MCRHNQLAWVIVLSLPQVLLSFMHVQSQSPGGCLLQHNARPVALACSLELAPVSVGHTRRHGGVKMHALRSPDEGTTAGPSEHAAEDDSEGDDDVDAEEGATAELEGMAVLESWEVQICV